MNDNAAPQAMPPDDPRKAPPTTGPPYSPPPADGRMRTWTIGAIIGLVGLIVLIVFVRSSTPRGNALVPGAEAGAAVVPTMVAVEQERSALAKAKLTSLTHEASQAKRALAGIEEELTQWSQHVQTALNTDAGRAVAADPSAVERFRNVYVLPRPDTSDVEARRTMLAALVETPERALATANLYVPDEASIAEVQKHRAWAETKLADLRRNREAAESILKDAAATGKRGNNTLNEALAAREQQKTLEKANETASEEEKARQDAAQIESKARAAQIREYGKDGAAGVQAQTKEKVYDSRTDRLLDAAGGERERLLKLAKDPAIQAKFQPFLAKGFAVIGTAGNQNYEFRKPASFQLLQFGHALEGHENFALAGCGRLNMFGNNDRPRWPKPTNDAELEEMRQRFELFKKLAPIWIEMGLLLP